MRFLRLARRYGKMLMVAGWLFYLTYALASGKIEPSAAFDKLTSSEFVTVIFGVW